MYNETLYHVVCVCVCVCVLVNSVTVQYDHPQFFVLVPPQVSLHEEGGGREGVVSPLKQTFNVFVLISPPPPSLPLPTVETYADSRHEYYIYNSCELIT